MSRIDDLKQELRVLKAEYRSKMVQLHAEESARFYIKTGDLLLLEEGTHAHSKSAVYMVSRIVFRLGGESVLFGHKRLKDEKSFHHREVTVCLDFEAPRVIGRVDDWRRIVQRATPDNHDSPYLFSRSA
ncbi:hypothetical protein ACPOL_2067 [Acidisarcina polymorpha]|uniref:Uncharacterized protein n=1 Tax=Acidisarcina polymorpha TaxID=2211140 RepID=A0A2Z5FWY5_9BACT|nr:hypothetical protein [Acidisarcina polymorpha]AXC11403.1 hypothetical protein ACPOL_2067 [Acidisarcina polymorpha]